MHKLLILLLLLSSALSASEKQDKADSKIDEDHHNCEDVIVDDVTDLAFGIQGQPVTGMVKCFYDSEQTKIKSERSFTNGSPVGAHNCYDYDGYFLYSIIFKDGERHQWRKENIFYRGHYYEVPCVEENSSVNSCLKEVRNVCF